jgi:hypothetical protein
MEEAGRGSGPQTAWSVVETTLDQNGGASFIADHSTQFLSGGAYCSTTPTTVSKNE